MIPLKNEKKITEKVVEKGKFKYILTFTTHAVYGRFYINGKKFYESNGSDANEVIKNFILFAKEKRNEII